MFLCSTFSCVVRKSIAKVLTVMNQTQKANLRKFYRSKKFVPKDLRKKKTRAMRRALTKKERFVLLCNAQLKAKVFLLNTRES